MTTDQSVLETYFTWALRESAVLGALALVGGGMATLAVMRRRPKRASG